MASTRLDWIDGLAFDSVLDGHKIRLDNAEGDTGARPKGLLLTSLGGCTGMDIVSILKKMKVEGFKFYMEISADQTTEHPKTYTDIYLNFYFEGENLPKDKIVKAVKLSEERYCGVSAMLRKASNIHPKIFINNEEVK